MLFTQQLVAFVEPKTSCPSPRVGQDLGYKYTWRVCFASQTPLASSLLLGAEFLQTAAKFCRGLQKNAQGETTPAKMAGIAAGVRGANLNFYPHHDSIKKKPFREVQNGTKCHRMEEEGWAGWL